MSKKYGFDLLADQVAEHLASEWDWLKDEPLALVGDTQIEKLLLQAMEMRSTLGMSEFDELLIAHDEDSLNRLKAEHGPMLRMIVWPQAPVEGRRVDFLISACHYAAEKPGIWRRLIIECDGHDFHERTKEQAAKDRSKDRMATLRGYDFFRFTGSEIWRDPLGCAEQVFDWAAKGLFP